MTSLVCAGCGKAIERGKDVAMVEGGMYHLPCAAIAAEKSGYRDPLNGKFAHVDIDPDVIEGIGRGLWQSFCAIVPSPAKAPDDPSYDLRMKQRFEMVAGLQLAALRLVPQGKEGDQMLAATQGIAKMISDAISARSAAATANAVASSIVDAAGGIPTVVRAGDDPDRRREAGGEDRRVPPGHPRRGGGS